MICWSIKRRDFDPPVFLSRTPRLPDPRLQRQRLFRTAVPSATPMHPETDTEIVKCMPKPSSLESDQEAKCRHPNDTLIRRSASASSAERECRIDIRPTDCIDSFHPFILSSPRISLFHALKSTRSETRIFQTPLQLRSRRWSHAPVSEDFIVISDQLDDRKLAVAALLGYTSTEVASRHVAMDSQ